MWTWLSLSLIAWIPLHGPTAPSVPVPLASHAATVPTPLPDGLGVSVVWVEGDARLRPWEPDPADSGDGQPLLCGEIPPLDSALILGADARVVLIADDERLMTLTGPSLHRWTGVALVTLDGAPPTLSTIPDYREGPLPVLPPIATTLPVEPARSDIGLAFAAPAATTLRDPDPVLRWRWSEPDARFDLTLARVDDPSHETAIERWRALAGRSLVLWAPLERGAHYRATIALHGGRVLGRVVSDSVAFTIIGERDEAALTSALAALRAAAARIHGVHPEFEVLRARLFESYGVLAAAERAWAALALLYPDRPELNAQALRLDRAIHGG